MEVSASAVLNRINAPTAVAAAAELTRDEIAALAAHFGVSTTTGQNSNARELADIAGDVGRALAPGGRSILIVQHGGHFGASRPAGLRARGRDGNPVPFVPGTE